MEALPVSVVIPARNRSRFLAAAVRSAQAQLPPPAEIIVIDDASVDETAAVARALGVKVHSLQQASGSGNARNVGIAAATHEWIAFLDSDDEWVAGHLAGLWQLKKDVELCNESVSFVANSSLTAQKGKASVFLGYPGPNLRWYRKPSDAFLGGNSCMTSGVMARREALRSCGGFGTQHLCQDLDTWIRLLTVGVGVVSPRIGFLYRVHSDNVSANTSDSYTASVAVVMAYRDQPWFRDWHRRGLDMTWEWSPFREVAMPLALRDVLYAAMNPGLLKPLLQLMRIRRGAKLLSKQPISEAVTDEAAA